jgi:putative addiction module component (TIGR02574 family)
MIGRVVGNLCFPLTLTYHGCPETPTFAASCKINERMSHLPQNLERLSAAEKFELLDALWESLESDLPALSAEQRGELDYREKQYRENPAGVLPWEQIKTDLLKKR